MQQPFILRLNFGARLLREDDLTNRLGSAALIRSRKNHQIKSRTEPNSKTRFNLSPFTKDYRGLSSPQPASVGGVADYKHFLLFGSTSMC